jgi:hypothetical protein
VLVANCSIGVPDSSGLVYVAWPCTPQAHDAAAAVERLSTACVPITDVVLQRVGAAEGSGGQPGGQQVPWEDVRKRSRGQLALVRASRRRGLQQSACHGLCLVSLVCKNAERHRLLHFQAGQLPAN